MSVVGLTQYALWIAPAFLQVGLCFLMVRRNLRAQFPFFFSYTAYQVVSFATLFIVYHRFYEQYFYAYWTSGGISVLLGLAVIYEIFLEAFRPYAELRRLGLLMFRWSALVLALVAVVVAASSSGEHADRVVAGVLAVERSIRVLQCGLVLLLFLFADHLGLSWRHRVFGIALGFGFFAAVQLTLVTLFSTLGVAAEVTLSLLKSAAYTISALVWMAYMLAPQPARRAAVLPLPDQWDFALSGARGYAQPAYLSKLETAVERAFDKRKQDVERALNGINGHAKADDDDSEKH